MGRKPISLVTVSITTVDFAITLFDCPKLINPRQKLRKEIGDAFNDISIMLGGRGQGKQEGKISSSVQISSLKAVLDFAEASHRFLSRIPRQPGQHRP